MKMPMASAKAQSSAVQHPLLIASVIFNFFIVYSSSLDLPVQNQLQGGGYRGLKSFVEKASGTNITFDCSPSGPCVYCSYSEKVLMPREYASVGKRLYYVVRGIKGESKKPGTKKFPCAKVSEPCRVYPPGFLRRDESYRCSETGYRIPMKCVKVGTPVDEENENKRQKGRANLENTNDKLKLHELMHDAEDSTTSGRQRNLLEDSSTMEVGKVVYVTYRSCVPAVNEEKLSILGFEAFMLLLLVSSSFVIFRRKGTLIMPFMPGAVRVPSNPRF